MAPKPTTRIPIGNNIFPARVIQSVSPIIHRLLRRLSAVVVSHFSIVSVLLLSDFNRLLQAKFRLIARIVADSNPEGNLCSPGEPQQIGFGQYSIYICCRNGYHWPVEMTDPGRESATLSRI